jgi:hypothetical protein
VHAGLQPARSNNQQDIDNLDAIKCDGVMSADLQPAWYIPPTLFHRGKTSNIIPETDQVIQLQQNQLGYWERLRRLFQHFWQIWTRNVFEQSG